MRRIGMVLGLLALLTLAGVARSQGGKLDGNWQVSLYENGQKLTLWILQFDSRGGKLMGSVKSVEGVPSSSLDRLEVKDGQISFAIGVGNQAFQFEGDAAPINGKVIAGSFLVGGQIRAAVLELTPARNSFELAKELVTLHPNDPRIFEALPELIRGATREKASAKEVRDWVAASLKLGQRFGGRWQRENTMRLAEMLMKEPGLTEVAFETARSAEALKGNLDFQLRVLEVQGAALTRLGKGDQAEAVLGRLDKLESQAHEEYARTALPFNPAKYPGRKGTSNRAVLVELFTGAQCPPCVAADLAFDGVEKSFKPSEVVLLQYHLHIPGPDPLTSPASEARQNYYKEDVEGTPAIMFNGKSAAPGGGGRAGAREKFDEYWRVLNPLLEQPASVKLQAVAVRKGDKVDIRARVTDLDKPGAKVKLRIALVEDWVRYRARNGLSYHSRVVRAFPGGAAGVTLDKRDADHTATVNLDELRKSLAKYLDDSVRKNEAPFPDAQRPLGLRRLHVVAFVQNDANQEVLQAVETRVRDE
ncbi:MAG: hypothetical protein FJ271_11765 [Planctomycetes bacterium]|nr:hypothetical protein [Planctomycetota bacterium]